MVHLAVIEDVSVAGEGLTSYLHQAVLGAEDMPGRRYASFFHRADVLQSFRVGTYADIGMYFVQYIEVSVIECRMGTNLEMHFLFPCILYVPDDFNVVLL